MNSQSLDGSWQLTWEQLADEERKNLGASMSIPEREEKLSDSIKQYTAFEAKKYDTYKPRMELLSRIALEQMAQVLTFGAKKYDAHNWRKGMDWSRLYGAAMRHLLASLDGEDLDPESGFPHLAHAAVNLMFLLEYSSKGLGTDDRHKPREDLK